MEDGKMAACKKCEFIYIHHRKHVKGECNE